MSTKHTGGKWKAGKPEANGTPVTGPCGVTIAWCGANAVYGAAKPYRIDRYEAEANARLIAAAPEMLAALEAVAMSAVGVGKGENVVSDEARALVESAIAKAEGRS